MSALNNYIFLLFVHPMTDKYVYIFANIHDEEL